MKKQDVVRKGHSYHVDGLSTVGILFGVASVGFILYNVILVIFS